MKKSAFDPPPRLPVKLDTATNGEFAPAPLAPELRLAKRLAMARAGDNARRLGLSRRRFLESLCGAATTFLAMNQVFAARGDRGGRFDLPAEAARDPQLAEAGLAGEEFILDDQTHHVNPAGAWRATDKRWQRILPRFPQGSCGLEDPVDCFSARHFLKEIFLDSDTAMAVLSHPPAPGDANPLTTAEAAETRALVEAMDGSSRLLLQGMVMPGLPPKQSMLDQMEEMAAVQKVRAWKTYTNWGVDGGGWWLDDPQTGIPFIEKGRALGVKTIAIHKGLPFAGYDPLYSTCRDVGVAAKMFPDVNFVIYHAGFVRSSEEGPYRPESAARGVNNLVKSLEDNGIAPNSNVYADLGATWRAVMGRPTAAAHVIGKLLVHLGEDRLLWGTDSIWWGSPQDQIQAFRAFQIAPELRERHGYPELTPAIKAKVFGLNALEAYRVAPEEVVKKADADRIGRIRAAYLEDPQPSFVTYGPRSPSEFEALGRTQGHWPG